MALAPVGSFKIIRTELLLAARAAERWPVGRPPYSWFMTDEVEHEYDPPCRIPVPVARRQGDPAVVVAAYRLHCAGRARVGVEWRDVWYVQGTIVQLATALGVKDYMRTLSEEPGLVAALLRSAALEFFEEE